MKKKVILSTYAMINPIAIIAFLFVFSYWQLSKGEEWPVYLLSGIISLLCLMALFYAPISISLSDKDLSVNRSLKIKDIPLSDISSVRLCPPTMAERRLLGSGGFFGYWGWFSEPSIGRYFSYYGKASDCFLVTLKNGKKYMLGCKDAPEMVNAIQSKLI